MLKYVIVAILLFCSGFVDSIAGGGGLISLPAFLLAGLPPHMALATNKFSSSIGTTASTARFFLQGYMHRDAFVYIVLALGGAHLGSSLAVRIPERYFQYLMLIILPIVAAVSFYSDRVRRNKSVQDGEGELISMDSTTMPVAPVFFAGLTKKQFFIAAASALVVGTYDGFYGPGTGTFLILLLTQVAHIDVRRSAATTKAINLSSNIGSLIFFLGTNLIDYRLGLVGAAFSLLGHYLGSGLVIKDGQKYVRPLIIVVLILLFIKVISDLLA
ncbi:MAG: TSUP family transporter [Eubacteriales bacterium]|nr:TSUP family transporter [Eubacteriales bacterium]